MCVCEQPRCPAKGMHYCSACVKVQKTACGKKGCVDARAEGTLIDRVGGGEVTVLVVVERENDDEEEEESEFDEGDEGEEEESEEEEEWECEALLDARSSKSKIQYLVKWVGSEGRTWGPIANLMGTAEKALMVGFRERWVAAGFKWPPPAKADNAPLTQF